MYESITTILESQQILGPGAAVATGGLGIGGAALISIGGQLLGGLFGGIGAKKRERAARREKQRLQKKLNHLEANRQAIVNPMSGITNLSSLATNLSGQLTNQYANLSVATQAAEMEIEQADISLANTLDTLRATGAGAGGATALAQAAMKSKQGVSASIEQQEAQNEKLRAQGEQELQRLRMQEEQRMQGIALSEGARVQTAEAAGKQFVFGAQEDREMQQLDRVSAQLSGAQARQGQARSDATGALTGMLGSFAQIGSSYLQAKGS